MVRKGIPQHFRGICWQLLCNAQQGQLREKYAEYLRQSSPCEKVIKRDIARTYPEHEFFREKGGPGQGGLFNVMKAYSIHDGEVGYCQGSAFLVGVLLLQVNAELLSIQRKDYLMQMSCLLLLSPHCRNDDGLHLDARGGSLRSLRTPHGRLSPARDVQADNGRAWSLYLSARVYGAGKQTIDAYKDSFDVCQLVTWLRVTLFIDCKSPLTRAVYGSASF